MVTCIFFLTLDMNFPEREVRIFVRITLRPFSFSLSMRDLVNNYPVLFISLIVLSLKGYFFLLHFSRGCMASS